MNKNSLAKTGDKNPSWKGDSAKYGAIHAYVRKRKKKPELCEKCNNRKAVDLANVSGLYKRDLDDWEYLCRKCHMDGDGRNDQLRASGKSRRLPTQTCLGCNEEFHTDRIQMYCSQKCYFIHKKKK